MDEQQFEAEVQDCVNRCYQGFISRDSMITEIEEIKRMYWGNK